MTKPFSNAEMVSAVAELLAAMKPLRPLFLARHGYRRRRIMDAARVLPVLGAFLFFVPLLWTGEGGGEASDPRGCGLPFRDLGRV